jgi:hypothetical protein
VRGRRRWLWIALAVVAALLVAGGVAAVATTAGPVALPALPGTLDGARRSTDPNAVTALDAQATTLRAEPGVTSTDAAVYDGPGGTDRFLVIIAAVGRQDPDRTVADVIEGARSSGGATGMTVAGSDPGPLGGALRCGSGDLQGTPFSVCAWAGDRVIGVVFSYNRRAADGAGLTRTVRAALNR